MIVGYDQTGQAVARVLGSTSIPFVVLDMDPARLARIRDEKPVSNPEDSLRLLAGDRLVVYGPHAAIASAIGLFDPRPA